MTRAPALGIFGVGVLAGALASRQRMAGRIAAFGGALLGARALEVVSRKLLERRRGAAGWQDAGVRLTKTVIINRSPDELYTYWRRLENLPRILSHVESVHVGAHDQSHWVMRLPSGVALEWEAEVTHDVPNELLAWRSLPGSDVNHSGSVELTSLPGRRGTRVALEIAIEVPGAGLRKGVARLLGESPQQRIAQDLRELKQRMEAGEVASTEGQPSGRRSIVSRHLP